MSSQESERYDDSSLIKRLDRLQKQYEDLKKQMVSSIINKTGINYNFIYKLLFSTIYFKLRAQSMPFLPHWRTTMVAIYKLKLGNIPQYIDYIV